MSLDQGSGINNELQEKINQIKSKVSTCPSLSEVHSQLDADFFIKYLKGKDMNVDEAFKLIEGYFKMRSFHPELFLLPSKVQDVFNDGIFTIHQQRNSIGGEMVVIFRPGRWDVSKYDAWHLSAAPIPFLELAAIDNQVIDHGIVEILNFAGVTWKQFWTIPVSLHSVVADLTERALPICYKKIHVVNEGKLVDMLWTVMKPFVSSEMKARIQFHGSNYSDIYKEIDRCLLPPDLGGNGPDKVPLSADCVKEADERVKELWRKYTPRSK